jgi:hypothetical protein
MGVQRLGFADAKPTSHSLVYEFSGLDLARSMDGAMGIDQNIDPNPDDGVMQRNN